MKWIVSVEACPGKTDQYFQWVSWADQEQIEIGITTTSAVRFVGRLPTEGYVSDCDALLRLSDDCFGLQNRVETVA